MFHKIISDWKPGNVSGDKNRSISHMNKNWLCKTLHYISNSLNILYLC